MTVSRNYRSSVRAQQAANTRDTIIATAAELFNRRGYAQTSVAAIAEAAGVSVNTIYVSVGGKPALLQALITSGENDEVARDTISRILAIDDPEEVLRITARGVCRVREERELALNVLLDSRTADLDVMAAAELSRRIVGERFAVIVDHLMTLGRMKPDLDRARVEQIFWFYFGFESCRTLRALGWSWKSVVEWLPVQAACALLAE